MRAVDCFAGCGGTTTGLLAAGWVVALGIDVDDAALSVYRANHVHEACKLDLSDVDEAVRAIRMCGPVDLVSGSPPCTEFSCAGNRREGACAALTVDFCRIVAQVRPRAVLIENVTTLLRSAAWSEGERILREAGYSLVALRINAACCGVSQTRRRIFVIGVREASEHVLSALLQRAAPYNKTPRHPTVRNCLRSDACTFYYPARNRHSPCVRTTGLPAPTLRCNCLSAPPSHYVARHDDAGLLSAAHVLSVADAAAISSFPPTYSFEGVSRRAAGRLIGNCVPPKVAETVGGWLLELLSATPMPLGEPPKCLLDGRARRVAKRASRLQRLVDAGLLQVGATMDANGALCYESNARGDALLQSVLGWTLRHSWRLVLKPRCNASASSGQAPLDDLYIFAPGCRQPFRSVRQVERSIGRLTIHA